MSVEFVYIDVEYVEVWRDYIIWDNDISIVVDVVLNGGVKEWFDIEEVVCKSVVNFYILVLEGMGYVVCSKVEEDILKV